MGHIHTKPGQHDHTASGFIIKKSGSQPQVLLHVHKLLKKYLQFGGHIELHEDPWETVKHELREESGYGIDQLKILQPQFKRQRTAKDVKHHPFPISHNTHAFDDKHWHTDVAYAFVTEEDPKHPVAEGESGVIKAFTRQDILDLTDDKIYDNLKETCLFIFDECLLNWDETDPKLFDY
jgi:hypothetical protein